MLKFDKKTKEHIHIKKPVYSNNRITINFMLYLLNDKLEVKDSFLLSVLKIETISHC